MYVCLLKTRLQRSCANRRNSASKKCIDSTRKKFEHEIGNRGVQKIPQCRTISIHLACVGFNLPSFVAALVRQDVCNVHWTAARHCTALHCITCTLYTTALYICVFFFYSFTFWLSLIFTGMLSRFLSHSELSESA